MAAVAQQIPVIDQTGYISRDQRQLIEHGKLDKVHFLSTKAQ